ncbi:unnamed protein product, partial [Amoebophrya sp. A120]
AASQESGSGGPDQTSANKQVAVVQQKTIPQLSPQQMRNADNSGLMLLITTHALVLLAMHPTLQRLQREIFREYSSAIGRDEMDGE